MADQVITIRHNDKNEIFDIEDVNPENLKDHFEIEVKSLKNCQTGKVVFVKSTNIKLSVGATYEITSTSSPNTTTDKGEQQAETFDQKWRDENQETVQNALIASLASYETDAQKYLNSRRNDHNLKSVVQSVNGDCSFIMAESDDKKTVYVAFRGTNSWEDLITDFHIHRKKTQSTASRGKVHSGFLKRADAFPLMTVSEFLVRKKVVVCGHSLGGAISSLVFCHLLFREQQLRKLKICDDIINITFGSPLFADFEFRNFLNDEIKEMTPRPQMYHFVAENDIVPSLLCLAQSVPFLKENFQKPLAELQNSPLIRMLTPVLSAGLGIAPILDENKADTYRSLNEYIDILKADENKLSKKFVPIGNYVLLCTNETPKYVHCSNSEEILPYLDIFSSFSLENTENHPLKRYEEKCTLREFIKKNAFFADDGSWRSETLKLEKFAPEVSKGELLWEKYVLRKDLKLNLQGKNINCICLQHCNFNFGTLFLPEKIHSAENEVILHQPSFKEEISPSEHGLHIKIATVFGFSEYTLPVSAIKNIEVPIIIKFSKEARPMQILKAAFQRGVALSDMSEIPALENSLIKDIETLSKLALEKNKYEELNLILKKVNKELQKYLNSKSEHKILMSFLKEITQELESGLKLYAPMSYLQNLAIAIFAMLGGVAAFYFAGPGYFLLEAGTNLGLAGALGSAGGGFGCYGLSRMYNSTYDICLEFVVSELFQAWSKRNKSADKLREVTAFKNRGGQYNLEKALFLMFDPEIGKENFKDCSLKDVRDPSKDNLIKRIKCFIQMHELRESLATQCFIGVIGPQDAGKSTFLNKMWNCGAKVGLNIHTEKTTLYNINNKIKLVDFPGDNSFQEHSKAFSICGALNNITVVILPFTGDVSQLVSDELTKVYKAVADSSDSRVIVCINQCGDKLIQLAREEVRLRKEGAETINPLELLRSNYISKLNEYFESPSVESEPRQITFDAENLFFTDFELDIHDPRNTFGIVGVEEIKEALKKDLIDLGAIKSTDTEGLEAAFKKLNDES